VKEVLGGKIELVDLNYLYSSVGKYPTDEELQQVKSGVGMNRV
jgi:hypothetical protein